MPKATTTRSALNIPLIVLWAVSVAVAAFGYWFLQAGNTAQADFYNSGGSDYLRFLNLQTQSTIGGFLLVAGVIGVFIALATHARNRAAAVIAATAAPISEVSEDGDELDDDTFDGTYGAADEQPPVVASAASETAKADPAVTEPTVEPATAEPAVTPPATGEPATNGAARA
ncbi:hypothetical protein ACFWN7_16985 [Agromyces sp. NPDC058484]|uniref:hypothetical protein n=1 Tax=Agromyces sp. NPDC058484 TaxID=3346524 RepID=UPI00365E3A7E